MSKLLANQISNYNDNGPVEAKDGINVANGKPLQVAGTNGTSGDYLRSTGSSVVWTTFPSIPAAQVNADWNATSGVAQISNKPTLHAVATSGQYSDLSGLPSIPAAQIQSDWNITNTSSVDYIKNKPTLFSGSYNDLSDKPSIPSLLHNLSDVSPSTPNSNDVLKWNGSNWTPSPDATSNTIIKNITVTVSTAANGQSSGVFYMDGVQNPPINHIERGVTYIFDQSDSSNATFGGVNHPLMFSPTEDGEHVSGGQHYMTGITYKLDGVSKTMMQFTNGFAAATTRTVTWVVPTNAPDTLWYWCHHHTGQGNSISINNAWTASPTFTELVDTPANFTSQAGKFLKVNAGATALEYTDAPTTQLSTEEVQDIVGGMVSGNTVSGISVTYSDALGKLNFTVDSDANTTYSQSSVADGSNVKLRLTDSGSTNDDILITAGNNITISSVTAGGFTIASTGGGSGATVTTDDSAPSSPNDGDLWWKSDEGRLKIYYADGSSDQWVDASPVLSPTSMTSGSNSIAVTSTRSTVTGPLRVTGTLTGNASNNQIAYASHFIPDTNAAYDLGNAEFKVRHLFLSDNTLYYEGDFLKVAQHNSGGSAQSASYLIPLAKLKDALNASGDYEAFKNAILAITDA